ncbi:MAG: LysM peptidoglycan-binding domain-containing protein [Acidimicrobiales bacterium]
MLWALAPSLSLAAAGVAWMPAGAEVGSDPTADTYEVVPGDTLFSIARRNGTDVATLTALNELADPSHIRIGQVLVLATSQTTSESEAPVLDEQRLSAARQYVVVAGDTVSAIAARFGVTVDALRAANNLANPNLIQIGQILTIPSSAGGLLPPGPRTMPSGTEVSLVPANGLPSAVLGPPQLGAPAALGPVGSAASLPRSLFGSAANDPARLALIPSMDRWAAHYQIDRNLLKGLAYVESSWRVDAISSAGAVGVGQLMPATSAWIASYLIGDPTLDARRADDNIRMSARYVRYLIDQLGVEDQALGAYYQGIGSVQRDGMGSGTLQYIARVRSAQAAFAAG